MRSAEPWHAICSEVRMGAAMPCSHVLRQEHNLIGEVLSGVDVLTLHLRRGGDVPPSSLAGAIDFFTAFVDRLHDGKEEQGLFPVLAERGVPDTISLAALHAEHEEGRRLLRALRPLSAGRSADGEGLDLLEAYSVLLRRHIAAENTTLLPLAERVLSVDDEVRVQAAFDRVEEETVGRGGLRVLLALAGALTDVCRTLETPQQRGAILAGDAMRAGLAVVAPEESLARAAELMITHGIREVPVVAADALVGILTRSDLEPHRGHYEWTAVRAAMTPDPITVSPHTPLQAVARILVARSINCVPVTEGGRLVGMLGRADLLRLLAESAAKVS